MSDLLDNNKKVRILSKLHIETGAHKITDPISIQNITPLHIRSS